MKNINIAIPDNLSPEKELALIVKKLAQKQLSGSGVNKKQVRIGQEYNVKELETQITITRVNKEKPVEFLNCSVCNTEYGSNFATPYFHNYGGTITRRTVCSVECRSIVLDTFGSRVSAKKNHLRPHINFFRR